VGVVWSDLKETIAELKADVRSYEKRASDLDTRLTLHLFGDKKQGP
jgi:hypothetical protein